VERNWQARGADEALWVVARELVRILGEESKENFFGTDYDDVFTAFTMLVKDQGEK